MKKILLILSVIFMMVSCENPNTDSVSGTPEIKKVIVSDLLSNLTSGIEKDTFYVGDTIYFGLSITDTDMDLDKVIITQRSSSQNIDPVEMPIPEQFLETNFLYSYMIASLPGAWTIEGYVIDDKGNRSNTVTKKITVN